MKTFDDLIALLRRLRPVRQEALFQTSVRSALTLHHFEHEAEKLLTAKHRIDFFLALQGERIGIETKVAGATANDTARQLIGYGQTGELDRIILLTTRPMRLPIKHVEHGERKIPIIIIDTSLNAVL